MERNYVRNDFIAGVFDRAANTYGRTGPEYFKYFGERLIDNLKVFKGASILDVACGKGALLFPASLAVGPEGSAVGIDFSGNMVKETVKTVRKKGYANINVRQMDAEKLLFGGDSFDFISCGFAIQFFADYGLVLSEVRRVLRPGGKIGFSVWKKKDLPPVITRIVPKYVSESEFRLVKRPNADLGSAGSLETIFSDSGFINVTVSEEAKRFYYKDKQQWWQDQWSHAGRIPMEIVEKKGAEIMKCFVDEVSCELDAMRDEKGIYFDADVLFVIAEK